MADEPESPAAEHHFRRMVSIWVPAALVVDLVYWFAVGPHVPPGKMTSTANGAQFDFNVLIAIALPVMIAVWVYLGYAIWTWSARRGGPEPVIGPNARGHLATQVGWIAGTTVIVLGLFVFGTVQLIVPAGAGGGEGPAPIWTPSSGSPLVVQVIAQQWKFTYRYPSFGGMETTQLVLPDNTTVAFHVTSLDVIHDFWAYQLGVKADANPGQDNVAYTTTQQLGSFTVRCDELCGLWHGAMYNSGVVLPATAFVNWAASAEAQLAGNTKFLPQFAWTYTPDANGADGGFYPDTVDPYSNVEVYGAQKVKT